MKRDGWVLDGEIMYDCILKNSSIKRKNHEASVSNPPVKFQIYQQGACWIFYEQSWNIVRYGQRKHVNADFCKKCARFEQHHKQSGMT